MRLDYRHVCRVGLVVGGLTAVAMLGFVNASDHHYILDSARGEIDHKHHAVLGDVNNRFAVLSDELRAAGASVPPSAQDYCLGRPAAEGTTLCRLVGQAGRLAATKAGLDDAIEIAKQSGAYRMSLGVGIGGVLMTSAFFGAALYLKEREVSIVRADRCPASS